MTPEASIERSIADPSERDRMTVTLNDVARRAGVSKSTVSNVVRGAAPVAPSTRRRVEGAISELGYRPNEVARALKQRSTQTLGLVITDTVNPFAASLAQAVVRRARRDGYAVLIADTDGDPQIEAAQVRALVARRVDGVIFAALTEGSTQPRRPARPRRADGARVVRRTARPPCRGDRHRRGGGDGERRPVPRRPRPHARSPSPASTRARPRSTAGPNAFSLAMRTHGLAGGRPRRTSRPRSAA